MSQRLSTTTPPAILIELRKKHGFEPSRNKKVGRQNAGRWSRQQLSQGYNSTRELPALIDNKAHSKQPGDWQPRHTLILNEIADRFAPFGFRWWAEEEKRRGRKGEYLHRAVRFANYPTVGGWYPTLHDLLELPIELVDGFENHQLVTNFKHHHGGTVDFSALYERIDSIGMGYKGMAGVSWLPTFQPLKLPVAYLEELMSLGEALFMLYDAVAALYDQDPGLKKLLAHKVPARIPTLMEKGRVEIIRPDIVIVRGEDGLYHSVCTELESCPAGQGMCHALEVGYQLPTTMVDAFISYLAGRPFVVFATAEWSEYVWDQAVFIAALRVRGVEANLYFDAELDLIQAKVAQDWQVPKEAPEYIRSSWNNDFLGRLKKHGFADFVFGKADLPAVVKEGTVVYRFGYFDNLASAGSLETLLAWQSQGASIVNPLQFPLENKALMAAVSFPSVRQWLQEHNPTALRTLERGLATTYLLWPSVELSQVQGDQRQYWLTKFGAWDGQNQSWGARSLSLGTENSADSWNSKLRGRMALNHPVVVQHIINSARFDVPVIEPDGTVKFLIGARTRLNPFFLRDREGKVTMGGRIVTLRSGSFRVHGATDAAEAPVIFV